MAVEIASPVSDLGQVTIPAEVRDLLRLRANGTVVFRIEDGRVSLVPRELTLEETFGSVTPLNRPEDFEALSRQAKEEKADRTVRKIRAGER